MFIRRRCSRAAGGVSSYGSVALVFALALVDNLLEQEAAGREDEDKGPDLEGGLGGRGVSVRGRFVGAGGLSGLAETRGESGRGGEGAG